MIFASFSVSGFLSSPFYGWWIDRKGMKSAILLAVFLGFMGNLIYGLAFHPYMILISRLVAGIGSNFGICLGTYVSRTTTDDERSPMFAKVTAFSQIGLLIGPAFNFFLSQINWQIGGWKITPLSSPGYFASFLLLLSSFSVILFFQEPEKEHKSFNHWNEGRDERRRCSSLHKYKQMFNLATIGIFLINFVLVFIQITLETIATLLTQLFFNWKTIENSIFYCLITLDFLIFYLLIHFMAKRGVSDRILLIMGQFSEVPTKFGVEFSGNFFFSFRELGSFLHLYYFPLLLLLLPMWFYLFYLYFSLYLDFHFFLLLFLLSFPKSFLTLKDKAVPR
jgi:MFS family permease